MFAQLTWNDTVAELQGISGQSHLVAEFRCKNNSSQATRVLEVRTSCGCTVVGDFSKDIKPGAEGTLSVRYNIGDRTGPINQSVVVKVAGGPDSELFIRGKVEEWAAVNPRLLVWRTDDRAQEKVFDITIKEGVQATVMVAPVKGLKASVRKVQDRLYRVSVVLEGLQKNATIELPINIARSDPTITLQRTVFVVAR